ncbi:hypothetical protein KRR39_05120 [Nocardioides panacis]|uniref:Uncharacterized protein n=1 Tax=Nocardioides panacis TaxID=2849501 RepID=A0A975Y2P9_9ACTN|nr:hypothetical protein [Nocardioides panacis]QWZ10775.1 hypothetical protein KRR39_05120 [Nocardioides panacis]
MPGSSRAPARELHVDPAVRADDRDLVGVAGGVRVGPAHHGAGLDHAALVDDRPVHHGAPLDDGVREQHAVADHGTRLDDHPRSEHAAAYDAGDPGPRRHDAVADVRAVEDPRGNALRLPGQDRPARVVEQALVVGEHVLVGRDVEVRLAQVAPVAGQRVHDRAAPLDQPGQQVVPEVAEAAVALGGAGRPLAVQLLEDLDEHLRVVDEDLRGDRRGGRLLGLVGEPGHRAGAVGLHRGVVAGLLDRHLGGHHGALGVVAAVRLDGVGVVEAVDVVGAQHDDRLGIGGADLVADPEQLVGVALREPVLLRGPGSLLGHQQPQPALVAVEVPGPTVCDRLLDAGALELQGQPHLGDPAVRQVGQREVDELVDPGERQGRLGPLTGEDVHPAAGAAGLDDGQDPVA